ncbi:hypothetical protein CMI47_09830 [Candidatus Pacearchaeota archaeon]|nr:hypothetical protein [Candidatus Pacearchaeota archaeon]
MVLKMLLVVNYHYIRDKIPHMGIHPITPSFFKKQLELISTNGYKFVSVDDVNKVLKTKKNTLPEKSCLITFDDGLKESYDIGLSILDDMGIPAFFSIISDTIINDKLVGVHKLQYLRTQVDTEDIEYFLSSDIETLDKKSILNQYPFDDTAVAKIKYLLNFVNPGLVDKLFSEFITIPEKDIATKLYMDKDQIKDLYNRGFLGTHSKSHKPLAALADDVLFDDIKSSINDIENLCGGTVKSISYPYGEKTAVDSRVVDVCEELGLVSGFTMFRGINDSDYFFKNPYMLKRLDTTEVFGGKYEGKYEL